MREITSCLDGMTKTILGQGAESGKIVVECSVGASTQR
jgi:hypothetical protein